MSIMSSHSTVMKREKSAPKFKKSYADDGFSSVYYTICQESDIKYYPQISMLQGEPVPWPCQLVNDKPKSALSQTSARMPSEKRLSVPMDVSGETIAITSEILAVYNNPENENVVHMLIYKHFAMEDEIMGVLQKTFVNFPTLRVLKLEYCNLTSDQLRGVKFILLQNENITELSLDGNPIGYQNHYIVLKNTYLQYLSLKFCRINLRGVTKIATYLQYPSALTLFGLDLSNNFVQDQGCKLLADGLRTNRTLTHLSLANNMITDEGCEYLFTILRKFTLTHEEIMFRRKCNMEYLLRKMIAIQEARDNRPSEIISARPSEASRASRKSLNVTMGKSRKDKPSMTSSLTSNKRMKRRSFLSDTTLPEIFVPKDPHPYMHECTAEDKEVYCAGNFKLTYLNLAYNNMSCYGIRIIKETLKQQHTAKTLNVDLIGLSKLRLEGNFIKDCRAFKDVMDTLEDEEKIRNGNNRALSAVEFRRNSRKMTTMSANLQD